MEIERYTTLFTAQLEKVLASREPANLYDPVNYIMTLGGKRIRPSLALMSCDLFGSDPSDAMGAAMAVEMFHNFTLIHDDIMDAADLRRGKLTVHKKWNLNSGILSGDVLMILSYQQLQSYKPGLYKDLMDLFNKTAVEVCEGQQMDMDFEDRTDVEAEEYFKMIEFKTAVLLGCALKMGAMIAGANPTDQDRIYGYGVNLGIAFQLQDDYLDSFGGSDFGKRIGGDILERKKTLLFIRALELCGESDKRVLLVHYKEPNRNVPEVDRGGEEARVNEVKTIFKRSGAEQILIDEIEKFTGRALQNVESLSLEEKGKDLLRRFSRTLMKRKV